MGKLQTMLSAAMCLSPGLSDRVNGTIKKNQQEGQKRGTENLFSNIELMGRFCVSFYPLMTLGETTAITLRLLYLAIAFGIVFIVNRFFFPIRHASQFRYSIKALFRLHNSYWNIIRRGLESETDLSVSTDILTDFHMYFEEAETYMRKHKEASYADLENALIILWHMFAELEQIHYLVRIKSIQSNETEQIIHLITAIQKDFYPIIRKEDFPALYAELRLQHNDIAYVIREYLKNAEKLLDYKESIPFR